MVQSTASDMPAIVFSGSHLESYGRKFSPISTNGAIVKLRSTGVFNITIVWDVPANNGDFGEHTIQDLLYLLLLGVAPIIVAVIVITIIIFVLLKKKVSQQTKVANTFIEMKTC